VYENGRAEHSIRVFGLNRISRLNEKRAQFWDDCAATIAEYQSTQGAQALDACLQALALTRLRKMIDYAAEFSSVMEACLRKNAPESLVASVFGCGQPTQAYAPADLCNDPPANALGREPSDEG
jgi:hypothetical protein